MDKILGRTRLLYVIAALAHALLTECYLTEERKSGRTKPFANFGVFHDNLVTRLSSIRQTSEGSRCNVFQENC